MKRAALYVRVSTVDQNLATQLYDLRTLAQQRGMEIVGEYTDKTIWLSIVISPLVPMAGSLPTHTSRSHHRPKYSSGSWIKTEIS